MEKTDINKILVACTYKLKDTGTEKGCLSRRKVRGRTGMPEIKPCRWGASTEEQGV